MSEEAVSSECQSAIEASSEPPLRRPFLRVWSGEEGKRGSEAAKSEPEPVAQPALEQSEISAALQDALLEVQTLRAELAKANADLECMHAWGEMIREFISAQAKPQEEA